MGMAAGSRHDGRVVVVSEILICRMPRAASYPAYKSMPVGRIRR